MWPTRGDWRVWHAGRQQWRSLLAKTALSRARGVPGRKRSCWERHAPAPSPFPRDTATLSFASPALSPACPQQNHVGEALPPDMVTRLYDGMQRVHPTRRTQGPSKGISREQFRVSMAYLLKGSSEEKSLMILKMTSATEGPVEARELQKVGAVARGASLGVLALGREPGERLCEASALGEP